MKKVVIIGCNGQDGFYLNNHLLRNAYEVFCLSRSTSTSFDVGMYPEVESLLIKIKPDLIFHLAAESSVSHDYIIQNQKTIVNGTLFLLEIVDKFLPKTKVFIASSGLVFENKGQKISIHDKIIINSAYTLSRVQSLEISRYYRSRGRFIYTGFFFNHESPRRNEYSIARSVARDVVEIFLKKKNSLNIGNYNVIKEWLWAGDAVRAMPILLMQENIFEICIADGIGYSILTYASKCCNYLGIQFEEHIRTNKNFSSQYSVLIGDSEPLRNLGWRPEVDLDGLVKIMIDSEIASVKLKQNMIK